jgi:hypothetical protein
MAIITQYAVPGRAGSAVRTKCWRAAADMKARAVDQKRIGKRITRS